MQRQRGTARESTPDVSHPRIVTKGSSCALVRRTTMRKFFWTPRLILDGIPVHDLLLYPMALAQERHGVEIHHVTLMPNHVHVHDTDPECRRPQFMGFVIRESGNALKAAMIEEGYEEPESIWNPAVPYHATHLANDEAHFENVVYQRANATAAGLCSAPDDYIGLNTTLAQMRDGVIVIRRPPIYFARSNPYEVLLRITISEPTIRLFGGDRDAALYHLAKTERQHCTALSKILPPPLSPERLSSTNPYAEPRTPRKREGERRPYVKVGGSGAEASALRRLCQKEIKSWRKGYRGSWKDYSSGNLNAAFPYGSYQMPRRHFVPVDDPDPDAVIARPIDANSQPIILRGPDSEPDETSQDANPRARLEACKENLAQARANLDPNETMAARLADDTEPPTAEAVGKPRPSKQTTTHWASVDRRPSSTHPSKLVTLRHAGKRRWLPKDDEDT